MNVIISCAFNINTACVELQFLDGSKLSIACQQIENLVANDMYERSELDWLIYNDPVGYAELIFSGNLELKLVSVFKMSFRYSRNTGCSQRWRESRN